MFTLNLVGFGKMVFVSSPSLSKRVFTGDPDVLQCGKASAFMSLLVGPTSVFVIDGDEHLRQRRLLLHPFHSERTTHDVEHISSITRSHVARWPVGAPFALYATMEAITIDSILSVVFGLSEGAQMDELRDLLLRYIQETAAGLLFMRPLHNDVPLNPFRSFFRVREAVDENVYRIIRERRRADDLATRTDVLSLLLRARDEDGKPMTDLELRDQLISVLTAGYETTATAATWLFHQLTTIPEVMEKAQAELRAVAPNGKLDPAGLSELTYLDAVVKESLRIMPIIPVSIRKLSAPFPLGDYLLPPGVIVTACPYLTHKRPDLYPDPEKFSPERFLEKKVDFYEWLPFGGGVRRCLGMAFALHEMKVIAATILLHTRLRSAAERPQRIRYRGLVLAPSEGTRVIVDEKVGL